MQTLVQVVCTSGRSLRDAIVNDRWLERFRLRVLKKKQPGRPRGWAKLHSTEPEGQGAVNVEWDADAYILLCRVVNRGKGRPNLIVGDLTNYLLRKHRSRIIAINVIPGR
jgi:hypothetical protein